MRTRRPLGSLQCAGQGRSRLGETVIRRNRVIDHSPAPSGEWDVVTKRQHRCEMVVTRRLLRAQSPPSAGEDVPITNISTSVVRIRPRSRNTAKKFR